MSQSAESVSLMSMLSNAFLAIIKMITGIVGNSFALIADAIESTTDIFSSFLVYLGIKYANKPADENHPYGHGRIEPLVTFLVVGFLVISAMIISYQSIKNIQEPHQTPEWYTLIVLGAIIIWKELSYRFVKRKSKEIGSKVLSADAWHHRSDAITSAAAFIGISIALFMGPGWESADDWAALFASIIILYNAYLIFRPALSEVLDEHIYDDLIEQIRKESFKVAGVRGTEKCIIRKLGNKYLVDIHAWVDGAITVNEGHIIAHRLIDQLKKEIPLIEYVNVHIEPFFPQQDN